MEDDIAQKNKQFSDLFAEPKMNKETVLRNFRIIKKMIE